MKYLLFLLGGFMSVTVLGSAHAQPPASPSPQQGNVLTARNVGIEPLKSATADPDFVIGADDLLSIEVWKEPELSRTVPVRPDGKISLPLVNDLEAAGMTPTQLASTIRSELGRIVVNPQVTVIVTQINSRRIYVLGAVVRVGAYPLISKMTVLQALSTAGGFTMFADTQKIYVIRTENGLQQMLPFQYKEVISGRKPHQNIQLKPGDTVVVP